MQEHRYTNDVVILGIPDAIVEHGTLKDLHKECGYDAEAIGAAVRTMMGTTKKEAPSVTITGSSN